MMCMCAVHMLSLSQIFQPPEQLLQSITFKRQYLAKILLKFGGRYRNQVRSDLGACPGIHRKSIALDQRCIIKGSVLKLKARVGRIRQTKIKFELYGVSVVGIARKMVLLAK